MATKLDSTLLANDLETLFAAGALGRLPDQELLMLFLMREDASASDAAFSALVTRHGPMVLGACRRMLGDEHLAADAYQAVFLILARKARSVRVDDSLGRWLYGVSVRVASRARAIAGKERGRMTSLGRFDRAGTADPSDECQRDELRAVIDDEIDRLPSRYRLPVVLCYLEGMTREQAARRLRCPVGTLESRLHRARERLRTTLTRRGLAPADGVVAGLAAATARADVPPGLAVQTTHSVASLAAGGALADVFSITTATLARLTMRSMLMTKGLWAGFVLMMVGLAATGVSTVAGAGDKQPKIATFASSVPPAAAKSPTAELSLAERFKRIRAEYDARQIAVQEAVEKTTTERERNRAYQEMSPDEVAYCRRMLDLAMLAPADPVARDALVWVINKPNMADGGTYGDEFARAAAMLVRHHGDDPEAVRVGLKIDNQFSPYRDALLMGFYAAAKCHEAKGLARLGLAQYLEKAAIFTAGTRMKQGRRKVRYFGFVDDNGKTYEKEIEQTDEEYSYLLQLRLRNPDAMRAEAERLYAEVIAEYGDVPYRTVRYRELEALIKDPSPRWNGKPLTNDYRRQLAEIVARKRTLADEAEARIDNMHNLVPGKPAPEIDGVDCSGKTLKLSDYPR
jgi:RNA polymerase sigma factor (sigma-70 family)